MAIIGDQATCKNCGKAIEYVGPYWRHTTYNPRHVAEPGEDMYRETHKPRIIPMTPSTPRYPRERPTRENCLHNGCSECHGTGRKEDGGICVHMISCPCPRCNRGTL